MSGIVYLLFFIPPVLVGFAAQQWLKRTVAEQLQASMSSGLSGAQVARELLDRNGLHAVPVERAPGGPLSDHYDPRKRALYLSAPVYDGRSVASAAIAAHEAGHALQHAKAYKPLEVRSALFPVVAFASNTWTLLLLIGLTMQATGLIAFAAIVYAAVVVFQLVTLPVEFDASRRALAQLSSQGIVTAGEQPGARRVLTAAAVTYVVAALAALTYLLFLILRSRS
jgi:Zn-dependent membrane protease YugP